MAEISENGDGQTAESITTVVRAHIRPDKEQEYEQWLHGINEDATQFAGFLGATILRPDDESHQHPEYVVVVRFATYSDLRRWEHSTQFAEWQRRLEPLLVGDIAFDRLTGTETWFTLPGHTVVVLPSIGISLVILLVISFAMTWVTMPLLSRLARGWLYPTK